MKPHLYALALLLSACGGEVSAPQAEVRPAEPPPVLAAAASDGGPETIEATKTQPPAGTATGGTPDATAAAGVGDPDAGKATYATVCVACHQADGTGMNGMLAGDFVHDKTRLARPDEELIQSVKGGKTGKIGTMPPMEGILSDQEILNALAYIRREFGGS
ncbi:MAG: cytochrome c [Deltaproteobacteria bacterium]|nr:cytochrome c [Deltaproteobacteria bacterium]